MYYDLTEHERKTVESYIRNFHSLKANYPNIESDYMREKVYTIVKGIAECYNNLTVREQQLFKLMYWDKAKHDKSTMCEVLEISLQSYNRFRERLLNKIAEKIVFISVSY